MGSSGAARARGTYAKTPQRREEITAAAAAIFATRGYRGGSLRDIARELGMSVTSLTYHFPTKVELLSAVLDYEDVRGIPVFERSRELGVRGAVLAIVASNLETANMQRLFTVLSTEATDAAHPAHSWFIARYERMGRLLEESIRRDQDQGRVRSRLPALSIAQIIIGAWDGLQTQWLLDETFDIQTRMSEMLDAVLDPAPGAL